MAHVGNERPRARQLPQNRPSAGGLPRFRMKLWGPLSALLLLLVSSRAQEPAPPIEAVHRAPDGAISQQTGDSGEETTLVFPDYVDGAGWSVQLALSNVDPDAAAEVRIRVYDQDRKSVADLFESESEVEIPALGSRIWRSAGEGGIRRGWIEVRAGSSAVSGLLTYRDTRSGIEVGVNPVELGQRFALYVEESPAVGSGVAILKRRAASGVELRLRDEEGYDPLEGEFIRWGDFRQGARTLPEWIGVDHVDTTFLRDFRGLMFLETEDGSSLIPLGLRFGKETSSLSAVPVIRNPSPELRETVLVFPDYVDGGGWSVQLVLSNVDAAVGAEAIVEVYDREGQAVADLFDTESEVEIPSLGSRVWRSTGEGGIRRGWIEVRTGSAAVSGLLTYRDARSGIEVGVNPVELGQRFALFVEESPTLGAGLAIMKRAASSGVELRLRDEEGNDPLAGGSVRWDGFRQAARTLPEWFDVDGADTGFLEDFRGLLLVDAEDESGLTPLGLRFGKRTSSLSAVPAIRIAEEEEVDEGEVSPPTVTVSVSRPRIFWGQSATLSWSSTNAESVEIQPEIGGVAASGRQRVSPGVTTTYRITARGADGQTATASVTVSVIVSQRAALQALYESLSGPDWTHRENWGTGAPLEDWYGVEADDQGWVTALRLVHRTAEGEVVGIGLTGEIPPELGALSHLRVLDLAGNQLTGEIPAQLGNLSQLIHLALHQNELTGEIPPQLGNLSQLTFLTLGANELTGEIPAQLGNLSQLSLLTLDGNELTGEIPAQLGNLSRLEILDLRENELTGEIPTRLGNLPRLEFLDLRENELTGEIPAQLGNLSRLEFLSLRGNGLTGRIPAQLGNLSRLAVLDLDANELAGRIPAQLGNLSRLEFLSLRGNELTGGIPAQLGNLSRLEFLSLHGNELMGETPAQLGNLTQLTGLSLYGNELTGPIPSSVLQLEELNEFHFADNAGLCAPGTTDFYAWLKGIENNSGPFCNESDVAVIESLYEATGGADWTNSDGWLGEDAVSEWHGVQADSLGRVTGLDLSGNGLEGRVPGNLAQLSRMIKLRIGGNALSGRLPLGLTRLPLQELDYADTELCDPVEAQFQTWLNAITSHEGTGMECAPATDRDLLVEVYDATGGSNWTRRENWLTDAPLGEWSGITVASDGRVIGLWLSGNGLTGPIPPELGHLTRLMHLSLGNNELTGPIPPELGNCTRLENLYLNRNKLTGPVPPQLGNLPRLQILYLNDNQLRGAIPPQLGDLSQLKTLLAFRNQLTGAIPPQLGNLPRMAFLNLQQNQLTGPIPPQLGNLLQLKSLNLNDNQLTGAIPPQLGNLSQLVSLVLNDNQLTGLIPAQLGDLSQLESLVLDGNRLRGRIPRQLGGLARLRTLSLSRNAGISGVVPGRLEGLNRLEELLAGDTRLCAPSDASARNWLKGNWKRRVDPCSRGLLPRAYLTQAVQSREFPVPLVAGEKALLRVFVTAPRGYTGRFPPIRARFYVRGRERYTLDIPGRSTPVPAEVSEGSLSTTANAEVPGKIVQPGLEMVLEIDPEGTLGPVPGLTKRIPETGRQAVEVRSMPTFDLTLIPFLWRADPDKPIVDLVNAMAKNPDSHEMLWATRTLLPIGDLEVTAHEPVLSSSNNLNILLRETEAIRVMEGASSYYLGMISGRVQNPGGVAINSGKSSVSSPVGNFIAHEIGHNLSLGHVPCGPFRTFIDPSFPDTRGSIGAWGYDFREGGRLVPSSWADLMGGCHPQWIGDYHFTNMLRFRLHTAAADGLSSLVAGPAKSLLLWGSVDANGTPFLEPAFVVKAPAALPHSTGEHRIIGRSDDGDELFSLAFEMPEVADGDGGSSFAFVLPVQPGWADRLSGITLSGPGGSVTLDRDSGRPVAILRNPRSGQIRGILRGSAATDLGRDDAVSTLTREPVVEVLTSRGIPDREDWTR